MSDLSMKHKNIGATVALLKGIHLLTDGEELPNELAELFTLESDECDWKKDDGHCYYTRAPFKCIVGNCPLGDETKDDLEDAANSIDLTGGEVI